MYYIFQGGNSMTKYYENGVFIYPSAHNTCHITYTGLLKQCGATEVYAHVGQGCQWQNTCDYLMEKTAQGFEITLPLPENVDRVNFCFKDSANNWDNNRGANYSLLVPTTADNSSLEIAEELTAWDACKIAFSQWFSKD
jgi:hypothetical protein